MKAPDTSRQSKNAFIELHAKPVVFWGECFGQVSTGLNMLMAPVFI